MRTIMVLMLVLGMQTSPVPDAKDPLYQSKGRQSRTYVFPGTDEKIPYEIYIPAKWDTRTQLPLLVVTHGAGQPATAPFVRGDGALAKFAEERGFVVAAVTGYHSNATGVGGWNVPYKMVAVPRPNAAPRPAAAPAPDGPTAQDFVRAELDILYVADLVAKEYNTDPNRVYLMGNSAGGSAVWTVATRFPERWTAVSPSAAPLEDAEFPYERMRTVPVLAVHGEADTSYSLEASKLMVEHAKAKGVDATFLPVPGGSHTEAWALVLPQTFDFFDKYKTKKK